ncbi:tRNA (adenosine(37)-N6)-threonylcarbamoyltransferase complex dimerization subunit type 1 TsaB [Polyangium jinanense]|uniref:tRNA (Adenosine(37)-N6)-threonylcarbamoyltransferase complex dimerization subunit type 1 TsaB n=1 Tax=Polyangium jinanense TaxID=2829994 RepID=A0A9X3XFG4_9BACT|nr:tRNA (adenosine(37)-N6)-threonylcarbamoyltransferase complex dimerization subunit type 1 TsaB [Polyangium jinanense]MDC3959381.1 tRNA (adenosine(37)-N6)-threonylcarbamoyltransferase complex dimerization subunit type 1 TsaB [Polyangium jinanense]MDC3988405.1 tRNA (adenosine(37)-N6)-threonylcarbamoyltransferase complex dimerization subunit type 1 TsaB [Polyangium jinanense]
MRLLAISTSTPRGSAAVFDGGKLIGASVYTDLEGHAERIFLAAEDALRAAGVSAASIEAFACDIGPGSFTGVRVGVAATKGMAIGRGAPLAGVGSLEAMAAEAFASGQAGPHDLVVAALDAKKQELFLAAFDVRGALCWAPRHVPRADVAALVLAGPGASLPPGGLLRVVGEVAAEDPALAAFVLRSPGTDLPDAAAVGRVALGRLVSGGDFDPEYIEPLYVRPPDAKPMASGGPS